jgi:hypothetical protein
MHLYFSAGVLLTHAHTSRCDRTLAFAPTEQWCIHNRMDGHTVDMKACEGCNEIYVCGDCTLNFTGTSYLNTNTNSRSRDLCARIPHTVVA